MATRAGNAFADSSGAKEDTAATRSSSSKGRNSFGAAAFDSCKLADYWFASTCSTTWLEGQGVA